MYLGTGKFYKPDEIMPRGKNFCINYIKCLVIFHGYLLLKIIISSIQVHILTWKYGKIMNFEA